MCLRGNKNVCNASACTATTDRVHRTCMHSHMMRIVCCLLVVQPGVHSVSLYVCTFPPKTRYGNTTQRVGIMRGRPSGKRNSVMLVLLLRAMLCRLGKTTRAKRSLRRNGVWHRGLCGRCGTFSVHPGAELSPARITLPEFMLCVCILCVPNAFTVHV